MDWLLSGQDDDSKCCLIGLYGNVLDVTQFASRHPGSREITLAVMVLGILRISGIPVLLR